MFGMNFMGTLGDMTRGIFNKMSGAGGTGDLSGAEVAIRPRLSPAVITALLRQDSLLAQAVEAMPEDVIRAWRTQDNNDEAWAEAEKKFKVKAVLMQALSWTEAFGGCIVVPRYDASVVSAQMMAQPKPDSIPPGSLLGFKVYMPGQLKAHWDGFKLNMQGDRDLPERFRVEDKYGNHIIIHHTWAVQFQGIPVTEVYDNRHYVDDLSHHFGESRVDRMYDALMRMNIALQNMSHMLARANLDVYSVQGLANQVAGCASTDEMQEAIKGAIMRAGVAVQSASIYQPIVIDAEEEIKRHGLGTGSGSIDKMSEVLIGGYVAVTRVPRTRLTGEQTSGLSNNDDGSLKHYYDRCATFRELWLTEPLADVDAILAMDQGLEIGSWQYNNLWQLTAKEEAEVNKNQAAADKVYLEADGIDIADKIVGRLSRKGIYGGDDA